MGDYSRDPLTRLADAVAKRYVGVRLAQGVPILDADWNSLDDIRRNELAATSAWTSGDGVPTGSDGFRILPLAGGGVGTVVLTSDSPGAGLSTVAVDLATSTAAGALGFGPGHAWAAREGSSPARLTSARAEPFALAAGQTLTLVADGGPPETVSFQAGDFANIAAATAGEVAAAIGAAVNRVVASAGSGNDFVIRGERALLHAGCILVGGQLTFNERDLAYSAQPLFENAALATEWEVAPVPALTEPAGNVRLTAYLDVWNREVRASEDDQLVDPRIGRPTTNRLRREWAVRVVETLDYEATRAARPLGHEFYPLAFLDRTPAPEIVREAITDLRSTEVSLRRAVAFRAADGALLVGSEQLAALLTQTRDNVRDFVAFLTTRFVDPNAGYVAGEVAGIGALGAVAAIADHGLALLQAEALGTRAAFDLFRQLADTERRLVSTWRDALFPVTKAAGTVYRTAFEPAIDRIESFLSGPAPAGFTSIDAALAAANLFEAVRSQEQINDELGEEIDRPTGVLTVIYLGSPAATIQPNAPFDLRFELGGSVTPDDDIDVQVFIDPAWQATPRNEDGTLPLALHLGPGAGNEPFRVRVRPPAAAGAQTSFSLRVSARHNSGGLSHQTVQKTLTVGQPPPPSEQDFLFTFVASVPSIGGVFQVPTGTAATVNFRLTNQTAAARTVDLSFAPTAATAAPWAVLQGGFVLDDQIVPANGFRVFSFQFTAPPQIDELLTFSFRARDSASADLLAEAQIQLVSVAP